MLSRTQAGPGRAVKQEQEENSRNHVSRDGEVPSQKELSSYFEELFSGKVLRQKELSFSNEELFPNPAHKNLLVGPSI